MEKNIDIIEEIRKEYKCISAYKFPKDWDEWLRCPKCNLRPLIWEYNNGSSTGCGCGENEYRHFSIYSESIMSYIKRHNGSALNFDNDALKKNWNHWVKTGVILYNRDEELKNGKW